jgi:hypothetical protein
MATWLKRKITATFAVILILAVTIVGLYASDFLTTTIPTTPLSYSLTLQPTNGTVLQGQAFNATLTISYLQGTPQNITLTSYAPNGITCAFANATGMPIKDRPFKSTMQITAPSNTTSGSYQFNITSTAKSGKTNSTAFTLTVLNGFINVSGTVTADFDYEIIPTEITFENTKTHEKFSAGVLTTPESGVQATPLAGLIQTGRYWVLLPNQQNYSVTCNWSRVPLPGAHFNREASGSYYGGDLSINCGVGVDSLVSNNFNDGA